MHIPGAGWRGWRRLLVCGLLMCLSVPFCPHAASAQQGPTGPAQGDEDLLKSFYKDPNPERLAGFLERHQAAHTNWQAYPPVAGFFAIVFRKYPDRIAGLVPARMTGKAAATVDAAMRLSGKPANAAVQARLASRSPQTTASRPSLQVYRAGWKNCRYGRRPISTSCGAPPSPVATVAMSRRSSIISPRRQIVRDNSLGDSAGCHHHGGRAEGHLSKVARQIW